MQQNNVLFTYNYMRVNQNEQNIYHNRSQNYNYAQNKKKQQQFLLMEPDFQSLSMKHDLTFQRKYSNIGWTNAVLYKSIQQQNSQQLKLYLPAYFVMKIKNFKNLKIQEMISQANVVLVLQIYYGELPEFLKNSLKQNLQIQFSMDEKIKTSNDEKVKISENKKIKTLTFTIRTSLIFQLQPMSLFASNASKFGDINGQQKKSKCILSHFSNRVKNSLWLFPFQILNQHVLVTLNKVSVNVPQKKQKKQNKQKQLSDQQLKQLQDLQHLPHLYDLFKKVVNQEDKIKKIKKISLMINLMDYDNQNFKINMTSTNQPILGHYSVAQRLLKTQYKNAKVQNSQVNSYEEQMQMMKKKRLKFDFQCQKKQLYRQKSLDNQKLKKINNKQQGLKILTRGMQHCLQIKKQQLQLINQNRQIQDQLKQLQKQRQKLKQKSQKQYSSFYRTQNKIKNIQIKLSKSLEKRQKTSKQMKQNLKDLAQYQKSLQQAGCQQAYAQFKKKIELTQKQKKQMDFFYEESKEFPIQNYIEEEQQQLLDRNIKQIIQKSQKTKPLNFSQETMNDFNKRKLKIVQQLNNKTKVAENRLYFQYANFNVPIFKNPQVTLATIGFPLLFLTIVSIFIYIQDPKDFGQRLANIATVMIGYIGYFQIIRQQIPKVRDILFFEIVIYLQISLNIACLFQGLILHPENNDKQHARLLSHRIGGAAFNSQANSSDETLSFNQAGALFKISVVVSILIFLIFLILYIIYYCHLKQRYTQGQKFMNACKNKEVAEFTKWKNYQADIFFMKRQSRLSPLQIQNREQNQKPNESQKQMRLF